MSKSNARKITVEATKCNSDSRRPSVFERLGTKPAPSSVPQSASTEYCRNWALNGNCSYGKNCKYANTHTLISPSKRAKKDNVTGNPTTVVQEDPFKRLTSKIVKKASHSPDLNLEEWNQTDLEYEDEKVLERRRQLLQRELELQMKKDKEVHGKDKGSNKHKKKAMSSSSSSRTSSSSSSSSSTSSSDDSSSSTTSDSRNKKPKKIKNKRHYGGTGSGAGAGGGGGGSGGAAGGPLEYNEEKERRKKIKLKRLGVKTDRNSGKKKRKLDASVCGKKSDVGKTSSSSKKSSSSTTGTGTVTGTGSGSGNVAASSSSSTSLSRGKYHPSSASSSGRGTSGTVTGGKSPSNAATLTPPLTKSKDRTRSESPKGKSSSSRDEKDRRSKKSEEKGGDSAQKSTTSSSVSRNLDRSKDVSDTSRSRRDDKSSSSKSNSTYDKKATNSTSTSSREKDRHSSRTPPAPPPPAPPPSKSSSKARRSSRTPEKSNSNSSSASSSRSKREATPRRLEARKRDRSRERDERRHESSRKNLQDERSSSSSRRSKERAKDKRMTSSSSSLRSRDRGSKTRDVVSSCFGSDKSSRSRDKERDGPGPGAGGGGKEEKLSRDRRNDRYEKNGKTTSSTSQSASASSSRFDSRYEKSSSSPLTSSSGSNLHKSGSGSERFQPPHERLTLEKIGGSSSGDAGIYERERSHRRYDRKETSSSGGGGGGGSGSIQPLPPPPPPPPQSSSSSSSLKIDRRMDAISTTSSPRRNLDMDRSFGDRGYGRIEHWPEERDEHLEFRDHPSRHDRKGLNEGRGGYSSPFDRGSDRRPPQRYSVQGGERQFEEHPSHHRHHHHHHHHHSSSSSSSVYAGDKLRGGSSGAGGGSGTGGGGGGGTGSREESGENWDGHREHIEHQPPLPPHPSSHPPRDRNYGKPNSGDWEDRSEWRSRSVWERENLQRPEAPHEEEWGGPPPRYDSPLPEWKVSESRNWESGQSFRGNYRNERPKDLEDVNHGKRRGYGNTPEIREECLPHVSKQAAIYGSMKDEPINKKLMELAEGRLRKSREKSVDSFHKKQPQPPPPVTAVVIPREKSVERKESEQPASLPPVNPPKRPCVEESVPITPALHTESDLSDISDDPDDILNMEDEEMEAKPVGKVQEEEQRETVPAAPIPQELAQNSPKEPPDEPIFSKERDEATISGAFSGSRSIEDENMETMDFEEISDGELEEDIKTSGKGLGDALGVDWESLVKESRPRKSMNSNQNVKSRWQCKAIFQRIGISTKNAGDELVAKLVGKSESDSGLVLLDGVALMHSALMRKKSQESRNLGFTEFACRKSIDEEDSDTELSLGDTSSLYNEAKLLLQQSV